MSVCDYLKNPAGEANIINNGMGCNSVDEVLQSCLNSVTPGIEAGGSISVFPNPADLCFSLKKPKGCIIECIRIYNQLGHLVYQSNTTEYTIVVSDWVNGLYMMKIFSDQGFVTRKFIINHL
jgi:hypothetical protein